MKYKMKYRKVRVPVYFLEKIVNVWRIANIEFACAWINLVDEFFSLTFDVCL